MDKIGHKEDGTIVTVCDREGSAAVRLGQRERYMISFQRPGKNTHRTSYATTERGLKRVLRGVTFEQDRL